MADRYGATRGPPITPSTSHPSCTARRGQSEVGEWVERTLVATPSNTEAIDDGPDERHLSEVDEISATVRLRRIDSIGALITSSTMRFKTSELLQNLRQMGAEPGPVETPSCLSKRMPPDGKGSQPRSCRRRRHARRGRVHAVDGETAPGPKTGRVGRRPTGVVPPDR